MPVDSDPGDAVSRGPRDLVDLLSRHVVGQADAVRYIVPYVEMYQAGFAPERRPAGIFLLLGPTGTGKTRTVEALAEVLHGTPTHVLTINCGEFQSDHEVARLVGAPPGYVGHRESVAMLSRDRLGAVTSPGCDLALVLFDEIEKAAPALTTLLLGILDRATLTLGDGREVDFSRSLIFLTSNLGAREMMRALDPGLGFQAPSARNDAVDRLETIALAAVRRRFSPEFVNRIDVIVTYRPLDEEALDTILGHHLDDLQRHVSTRLGDRCFRILVTPPARDLLLQRGTSQESGARELKRVIHRLLTQPLAARVARGLVPPGALVEVAVDADGTSMTFDVHEGPSEVPTPRLAPSRVLVVDDNDSLVGWMAYVLTQRGYDVRTAGTASEGLAAAAADVDVAVLDYLLPDGDGVALGAALQHHGRRPAVVIVSGLELSDADKVVCEARGFAYLQKPFMDDDLVRAMESVHARAAVAGA